jgi:Co/Zn/Cd efflux system component
MSGVMTTINTKPKHLDPAYRKVLVICALLNFAMLFIEGGVGLGIGSAALLADAADFLEDATVLGLSLAAIGWSARVRAPAQTVVAIVETSSVAQV